MKKTISLILSVLLLFSCFAAYASAAQAVPGDEVVLARAGGDVSIAMSADASPQTLYAARTLQTYLGRILGVTPRLVTGPADAGFVLVSDESMGEGSYTLTQEDGSLVISGGGKRGLIWGVYGFLEKVCGCRWYANNDYLIPQADEIAVPAGYNEGYAPYFEYAETDWLDVRDPAVAVANGVSGGTFHELTEEMGGGVQYISYFAHSLTNQFCSSASYFDAHPEYFALHGGKRTPNQLCLTNPDVLRIVTGEVLSLLESRHDPSQALQIVSLTQHDNADYCECPRCKALDDANGSHAGTMVTFANAVADAVAAAGYGNVAIDTFAYQYTRRTPSAVVPRDNVIIRLCSIECCFGHAFDDPSCPENAAFLRDLKDWAKICDRIYIWDYGTNYGEYANFFPNLGVLQRDMQIFYENNVKGVFGEGNSQTDLCDGEFSALRRYLQMKLMQDPYCDYDAEMNGFLEFYYGGGWESIRAFIDECCEKGANAWVHAGIFQRAKDSLPGITPFDVARLDALWEDALAGAQTEKQRERVRRSNFCWRYWKCANLMGEFSLLRTPYQRMKARDGLWLDLKEAGTTHLGETNRKRELSDCYALHLLREPFCWTTLYDNAFWDFVSPFIEKVYGFLKTVHCDA
ncbi:MAG: DUF4838 domain-containing protein [Clostridiales bacterium]|nr:DUF4838 domain-containing protein [Clostridiales bacterium]